MPRGTLFQMRRGTAADWTSVNPVLAAGEMGIETDTRKFKFGDGTTAWSTLAYGAAEGTAAPLPSNVARTDVSNSWTVGQTFAAGSSFSGGLGVNGNVSAYKFYASIIGFEMGADQSTKAGTNDVFRGSLPLYGNVQAQGFEFMQAEFRAFPAGHPRAPSEIVYPQMSWETASALRANGGVYDGNNRVYSDSNPPFTLNLSDQATTPVDPPAGQVTLYSPNGKTLRLKDSDGSDNAVGVDFSTDYTTTTPPTPATGLTLFSRHRARRTLAQIGPTGLDTSLQPALFSNRVSQMAAIPGVATEGFTNFSVARTAAPTAQPLAATNFFTRLARLRYTTAAQAGNGNGIRSGTGTTGVAGYFLSNTANAGGFFFVARFGVGISQAGSRGFIGLANTLTQHPLTADPVGLGSVAHVGFGWNAAATTFSITTGTGSGTAGTGDLGALFPTKSSATDFYEVRLFAPSGSASTVHYSIQRLNTGDFTQGTRTTQLPPADTFMAAHVGISNGTTAAAAAIDIQSLYIETDN